MFKKIFKITLCLTTLALTNCSNNDDVFGPIEIVIDGATITPEVGGPNQQNQVYIDLSSNTSTAVRRDSWDLGFYSGSDYRVVLNGSIAMATAQLSTTNIDEVNSTTEEVTNLKPAVMVGSFDPSNLSYVDAFSGAISGTAIEHISENDLDNKVYLINLGNSVGTATPATGAIGLNGESRGWKKIRVLKSGTDYILKYADLDATSHQEVRISKSSDSSFNFFSFNTNSLVSVEPETDKWDLNFTAFTDEVFDDTVSFGAYFYGDFVASNTKANVGVYKIDTSLQPDLTYDNFTLDFVNNSSFIANNQRVIGSTWRNSGGPTSLPSLKETVFYVVKDAQGNLYKLKFLALTNDAGVRGYPKFIYSLLQ